MGCRRVTIGESYEAEVSRRVHSKEIPLLISAALLREYDCGQVDVSAIYFKDEWCVALVEVKSSQAVSISQRARLKRSASFVSHILDCPTLCFLATGRKIFCKIN